MWSQREHGLAPDRRPRYPAVTVRLILNLPEHAPKRELEDDRTHIVLEGPGPRPAITLTVFHPRILQMSLLEWGTVVRGIEVQEYMKSIDDVIPPDKCHSGWDLRIEHTRLYRDNKAPQPFEIRLAAFYQFVPFRAYAAAAVARFLDPTRFEVAKPWILDLFAGARPDFSTEIVSLSQLYD